MARFLVTTSPGELIAPCIGPGVSTEITLGRTGVIEPGAKREGDGKTPLGFWRMTGLFFRPDREKAPITGLPTTPLRPDLGWCDAPDHSSYNSLISRPFSPSHEALWREDHRYDLIITLDHNQNPVRPNLGSAIFLHLMAPDKGPTAGCLGFERDALLAVLRACGPDSAIEIR